MLRYAARAANQTPFPCPPDMPEALHRLLVGRGIASEAEARAFLNPGWDSLHDPRLLSGMDAAAARLCAAMEAGETICIYGDYDVDGVCAAAILSEWLEARGANTRVYLPSRHSEGYGLNEGAVREIAGWAQLMVTVDCGVTSVALTTLARELGLDVIVTDHHRPSDQLPDCAIVNPLLGDYPFPALCGAGVAWKLVQALAAQRGEDPGETAAAAVDIAALATVADVVPLTGENRAIVRLGLDRLNRAPRPGIAALIDAAGLSGKRITASTVAFQLAPRLNAGGRLGSAMRSLELVRASDGPRALALAAELEEENTRRRQIERQMLQEAEDQLKDFDFAAHRALILAGKNWNPGVIGLTASRLVEKYHYPVVMLSDQDERMVGSCRSIEGVDIHAALTGCSAHLEQFGGHRQAAGLTLLPAALEDFRRAMDAWLAENVAPEAYVPVAEYDTPIDFGALTPGLVASLEGLQPTGFGNPAPVFRATAGVVEARTVGADGAHLQLTLAQDGRRMRGIAFREGDRAQRLPETMDVLFAPKLNTWMGRTEIQLEVRAMADADVYGRIRAKLPEETQLQCDFLTEIFYNRKIDSHKGAYGRTDAAEVCEWMSGRPQGTLVLAADLTLAARLLKALEPAAADLYFGEMPEDPRAFNAVCVLPRSLAVPRGYRRVVLAGMPDGYAAEAPEAETFRLEDVPAWVHCLPDVSQMRSAYRGLMRVGQRPAFCQTLPQLTELTADEAGLDRVAAHASILAMADMGLFELTLEPFGIRRSARAKAEPEQSAVWTAMQRWREGT